MDSNITLKNIYISGSWFCVCEKLLCKYMLNKVLHRLNFNAHRIKKWLVYLLIYSKSYFVETSKTHYCLVKKISRRKTNFTLKCNQQVTFWLKDILFFGVVNKSYSLINQLDVPPYLICFSYLKFKQTIIFSSELKDTPLGLLLEQEYSNNSFPAVSMTRALHSVEYAPLFNTNWRTN